PMGLDGIAAIADDGQAIAFSGGMYRNCDGSRTWTAGGSVYGLAFTPDYGLVFGSNKLDPMTSHRVLMVSKLDGKGGTTWEKSTDVGADSAVPQRTLIGRDGNIYVIGKKSGQLPGNPVELANEPFFAKYDPAGNLQWIKQLPKPSTSYWFNIGGGGSDALPADADAAGFIYVAGYVTNHGVSIEKVGPDGTG